MIDGMGSMDHGGHRSYKKLHCSFSLTEKAVFFSHATCCVCAWTPTFLRKIVGVHGLCEPLTQEILIDVAL